MKKVVFLVLLLLLAFRNYAQDTQDALVLLNKEERIYSQKSTADYYENTIDTKITRKIRILSDYGLNEFATLFIPTFKDLNFKTELVYLKAKTIKSNGQEFEITESSIRETTLPANIPFLRNYKGKVKAMAFENLNVGDEIHYEYQIKYITTSFSSVFFDFREVSLSDYYNIIEADYTFIVKNEMMFRSQVVNSTSKFTSSTNTSGIDTYNLNLRNIPPSKSEAFSIDEDYKPFFIYDVIKSNNLTFFNSWNEYANNLKSSGKNSILFGGKSIKDFYEEVGDQLSSTSKLKKVHDSMMDSIVKDQSLVLELYRNYSPDLEDINQVLRLLEMLEIKGAVLLVKSKYRGALIKDFVSLRQFDRFVVEYDEKGTKHYFDLFDPYANPDEVNSDYQGTESLKITRQDKKNLVSFEKVPWISTDKNLIHSNYNFIVDKPDNTLHFNGTAEIRKSGQFFLNDRVEFLLEKSDKNNHEYSDGLKNQLKDSYRECKIDSLYLKESLTNIHYMAKFQFELHHNQPDNMIVVRLSNLMPGNFLTNEYKQERLTEAVLQFPFENTRTLVVQASGDYSLFSNVLLNKSFENGIGKISCNVKSNNPKTVEITIKYQIKKRDIGISEWPSFLKFINASKDVLAQRILFVKK